MAIYTDDLIPDMTSNTAPSGTASASDTIGGDRIAFRAFDDSNVDANTDCWHSANVAHPHWVRYQFTSAKTIAKYTVSARDGGTNAPEDFTFEGSDNGSDWDVLDTISGEDTWASQETKTYYVDTPASYTYYQLNISKSISGDNYVAVGEMEMMAEVLLSGILNWFFMKEALDKGKKYFKNKGLYLPDFKPKVVI